MRMRCFSFSSYSFARSDTAWSRSFCRTTIGPRSSSMVARNTRSCSCESSLFSSRNSSALQAGCVSPRQGGSEGSCTSISF